MDDVVIHLVRLSPWGALNALGRVNNAAAAVLREVDPNQFSQPISRRGVDAYVLPNGVMHGIASYYNKRNVSMVCDRGRALSIRVTAWNCTTSKIDLERALIIHGAAVSGVECASGVRLLFDRGQCSTAGTSPLLGSSAEAIDDWIAFNMRSFDVATQAALTDRAPGRLIDYMLHNLWLGGESLDRVCALMTSPCPTPTLMRLR